eukprot:NODE_789_length_3873_cov_0.228405.p1 type:complete len:564 gc:universal NODE_789_length_3873_cov_0.228405:1342-3033(+)
MKPNCTKKKEMRRFARFSHKEIVFSTDARDKLSKGIRKLSRAVAVTLGPKGRNVLIEQSFGSPKITKDGVTVAKAVVLEDKFENLGAKLVQDVANKTNEAAGDGTTTATVLAEAIFNEALKNVAAGCNPTDLRKGVQIAVEKVIQFIKSNAKQVTTPEQIEQVATISANGDNEVGKLIAKAMEKVGKEGVITVQEGKTITDEIEITEGMKFDRGYISPYFVTDAKSAKVEYENPFILLTDKKISALVDILPALEIAANSRRPLLIMAEDVEGEALAACILNKLRGQVNVAAVKAPGFGDNRKAILEDLAVLTKGTVFNDDIGMKLEKLTQSDLGNCGNITITKDDTIILNGKGETQDIHGRCEQIKSQIDETTSEYEKEKLQERLAKLSGGVAVIKVGGSSEVEVGEKKDRYVDALNATKAAVEEGILPGGGTALLKASKILDSLKLTVFDQQLGVDIVKRALRAPATTIVNNAGTEAKGEYVVGKLLDMDQFEMGYDAANGEYVDMIKSGIVDPLKVTRTALQDASGVASLLATSECLIVDAPKPESSGPPMGGMPGMGGMM